MLDCKTLASKAEADVDETVVPGRSFLFYNRLWKEYTYIWKTERAWAGSCRQLIVKFDDGSAPKTAYFRFVR